MFTFSSISEFHAGLREKKFSISEAVSDYFSTIKKDNVRLNVFLSLFEEEAKQKAKELDGKMPDVMPSLYGVPMAIKDNILIQGTRTTAASEILEQYIASYDATVIQKLKAAGSVLVGKTNLDEFAMGSSTENSAFGVTKNPLDDEKVSGGSSGGSAAAVAARMAMGALGSDTGGSIRQPASFCGVVGLKPTYGAVSRHGVASLASSLDQIGPFADSVEDAARIFEAISGPDGFDATSENVDFSNVARYDEERAKKIVLGVPKEYFVSGMEKRVSDEIEAALGVFKKAKFEIREVSLPHTKYALSAYYIILPAEASANLGRYDGLRYGAKKNGREEKGSLLDAYLKNRAKGFGDEPTRRILLGTFVLSSGYYDAYYAKAQKVRRLIQDDFLRAFDSAGGGVDMLFTPVAPTTAFSVGEKKEDPLAMYLSDIFTLPINLAGLPALSIPVRHRSAHDAQHMPVNFQLIGRHFAEADLCTVGQWYERARESA